MRLCLTCYHLSAGASVYCSDCGRTFGGPVCRRGHRNPRGSRFCAVCGNAEMTVPTGYVPLGWVTALVTLGAAWLVAACAWNYAVPFLWKAARATLAWAIVVTAFLWLIPGRTGISVRRWAYRTVRGVWRFVLWRLSYRAMRVGLQSIVRTLQGRDR